MCHLPGSNILELKLNMLLPMHSNSTILEGETVECGPVFLIVASNDKYFLANILFEQI
jgi:hypothetical protein